MPFVIQSSTIPSLIGAGAGGKEVHYNDMTTRLTFKGGKDGNDVAVALATFKEGDELTQAKQWIKNLHGLTSVEIEPFDAEAAADKRQAQADAEAAERENANTEAKRILLDAKEQAAKMLKEAQLAAAKMLDDSTDMFKKASAAIAEAKKIS